MLSCVQLFAAPRLATHQASLSFTISWSLLKLMSIESVMPSNHFILCRPLLLLPSIFPALRSFQMSQLFASDGQNIGVSASTSVHPVNTKDRSPLGDWLDFPAVQGPLMSFFQHHSSKASVLQHSAFFRVHSHIHT